jgi:hypothetical protein
MNLEGGVNCIAHSCGVLIRLLSECPIPGSEQTPGRGCSPASPDWDIRWGTRMSKRYKRAAFRGALAGSDPVKHRPRAAYAAKCKAKLRILCLSQKTIPR